MARIGPFLAAALIGAGVAGAAAAQSLPSPTASPALPQPANLQATTDVTVTYHVDTAALDSLRRGNPMIRILVSAAAQAHAALPVLARAAGPQPSRDGAGLPASPASAPREMRMAFSAGTGRQRVDPPGGLGWMLIDRGANTAVVVMDARRAAMAVPPATVAALTGGVPPGARFTRRGTATVAGTACTEWAVTSGQGRGTSCITEDGVLLRAVTTPPNGTPTTVMEATQVAYGPVDAARLAVPPGYDPVQMPDGAPGAAPGAGPRR